MQEPQLMQISVIFTAIFYPFYLKFLQDYQKLSKFDIKFSR